MTLLKNETQTGASHRHLNKVEKPTQMSDPESEYRRARLLHYTRVNGPLRRVNGNQPFAGDNRTP